MIHFKIIRVGGKEETASLPFENFWSELPRILKWSQECPDAVRLPHGEVMLVDDCGAIANPPQHINPKATLIYRKVCRPGVTASVYGDVAIVVDEDFREKEEK